MLSEIYYGDDTLNDRIATIKERASACVGNLYQTSLQTYLETLVSSLRVRSVVFALVRLSTYCDAPDQVSAGAVIEQLYPSGRNNNVHQPG